jgi:membrane protein implicated in regulation of membrane protease activity
MSTADRMWLVVVLLCVAAAALFLTMVFIGADLIAPLTGARPWPVWTRRGALTTVVATGAVLASLWLAWRGVQPTSRSVGTLLKTTLWEDTPRTASPVSVFEDTPPPALDSR